MSEFSPAQLDALEDALEDLETLGVPPDANAVAGPEVAQRLDEYREILHAAREALPLQEVTPGLLDGVLAEAHAAVAAPAAEPAPPESWWKRFRAVLLVPAVAVAGSAALVLLLVRPGADSSAEETVVARTEAAAPAEIAEPKRQADEQPAGIFEQGLADASVDKDASRGRLRLEGEEADRGAGAAAKIGDVEAAPEAEEARVDEAEAPPPPPASAKPEPARDPAALPRKNRAKASEKIPYAPGGPSGGKPSSGGAAPGPTPAPAPAKPKPAPRADEEKPAEQKKESKPDKGKDSADADPWATISAGDRFRRADKCDAAKPRYSALESHPEDRVRARALAGLGLCALRAGNQGLANKYFGRARKAYAGIKGFIDHERTAEAPAQAEKQSQSL